MRRFVVILLVLSGVAAALVSRAADAPPTPGTIEVPRGRAPVIDGVVRAEEWKGALTRPLEGGGLAHFLHDGTDLFVGLSNLPGAGWGYGALLLGAADSVLVLHASAKTGSAVYRVAGSARIWRPDSKTYDWKDAPKLYAEEGWMADIAPRDGSKGREFRIARRTLGARRLALSYVVQTAGENSQDVRLPAWLALDRKVVDGWNPDSIAISPIEWPRVRLK